METKVLGHYRPTVWTPKAVGEELTTFTRNLKLVPHVDPAHGPIHLTRSWFSVPLHAEVRTRTSPAMSAEDWHQDGDTTPGANMNCCLVLWATSNPTEFKIGDTIYQPKPYEVVIAHNQKVYHRRPGGCQRKRWLFRQRVAVPSWMA
jgi:hypothetical protein